MSSLFLSRRIGCRIGLVGALLAMVLPLTASSEIPRAASHAIWRVQEIPFVYQSFQTRYDCNALRMKVKRVLGAIAVHDSTTIRPIGCSMVGESAQIASMEISVISAAPLTESASAELQARSSKQALLDRLGVRQELGQEFPAQWRDFDLARELRFEAGDCEFLRQLGDQVLSRLAVKVVAIDGPCPVTPRRFKQPRLKVQAFVPVSVDVGGLRTMIEK